VIEEAVAKPEPCLDQCSPRLRSARSIDTESPPVLERFDGRARTRTEDARLIRKDVQALRR
jgi:hypothetical protein